MSSIGGGGNFMSTGSIQFGVRPRSPLPTGLKRLNSESAITTSLSKLPRRDPVSGRAELTTPVTDRERLLQLLYSDICKLHSKHQRHLAELLFLQNNDAYLDFETWCNSSPPQLRAYLQAHSFDINEVIRSGPAAYPETTPIRNVVDDVTERHAAKSPVSGPKSAATDVVSGGECDTRQFANERGHQSSGSVVSPAAGSVSDAASTSSWLFQAASPTPVGHVGVLPVIPAAAPKTRPSCSTASILGSQPTAASASRPALEAHLLSKQASGRSRLAGVLVPPHRGPGRPPGRKNAGNIVNGSRYRGSIPSGRIEHAAKQEAVVLRRIAELRREGLWSADKLPRCVDPARNKTHWDYLLEEMKWLAIDFEQERKWKKTAARKLALMAVRQKKEEDEKQKRAELEREKELKRIAAFAAKEIRHFWNTIEKVVEYKADSILEAKRKRALDKHLDFIVGQTERFSSLVQEGLVRPSTSSVTPTEPQPGERGDSDFELDNSSEDDESTLDKEEEQICKADVDEEVALLQQECDMELDDILQSLPSGYLEAEGSSEPGPSSSTAAVQDDENVMESSEGSDNENSDEVSSLLQAQKLPEEVDFSKLQSDDSDVRQQELTHFAETAEKLQPKGYTLETTTVVTKVPFLLKHKLREYQHVGLDWLVTLYDRKLNGILADEMGLGKTIQTIALLAHLACEKGNWGPHLIVVPTTVMLNWEMELKKWCPGFKILTYYGSVKERKEKRQGWSKPNAFHVCITSYKLVLQDHLVFRRKKWEYFILDEAQNIKNFKSQRWQMLLHFNAQRRLLLTGTPLQNSLMELWSLMHFLMPEIFASHRDFRDWFSNPVTGMIEGSREYNEQTVKRLHKVLRPFILRRLKVEVEKQLPKKYEHVVPCALSKRQRYLYDDFMSRASTKDQLSTGNVMSVLGILMQLRKVCNHPNLFESRSIMSPFVMEQLMLKTPSLVNKAASDSFDDIRVPSFLLLPRCRQDSFKRCQQLAPPRRLIEELTDDSSESSQLKPPCVDGFKFAPLKLPLPSSLSRQDAKKKNFQFVIPPEVAQKLDFNQPFLVQIQGPGGPKLVPIQLRPPPAEALAKIGIRAQPLHCPSNPGPANTPVQLPIWRLTLPSQYSASTLQPPLERSDGRTMTNRLAVINHGAGPGTRPGFSVTLLRQPGIQTRFGQDASEGIIRTRTVLFRPAVPRHAPSTLLNASPTGVVRPQITVQEVRSRTPPVVRYVDPARAGLATLPASKPSTPVASTSVVPTSAGLPTSATSIEPIPGDSVGREGDAAERKMDSSPKSVDSTCGKPAAVSENTTTVGMKRSATGVTGLEPVAKRRSIEHRQQILQLMATENERRNLVGPVYGSELSEILFVRQSGIITLRKTLLEMQQELDPLLARFCIYTPAVLSGLPRSSVLSDATAANFEATWPRINSPFKAVIDSHMLQFPELRLIEYDCGKLQILTRLLRSLKDEGHRCLIFTQMAKMLDILEAFLSYLGLKYLRLDGATPIELRQVLMERFNKDPRIFCMILSTRSGGLGVNLTGADTVIFYDSDWNPTMDAQAQDRCHRIGQTRDVHIYRLVSEKTVEENILKKAQQKRRLGEVAIEEGSFTTEFFRKGHLKEIFDLSDDVNIRLEGADLSQQELEQQMASVEDENDAQAARCAGAETMADLSEFDESQAAGANEDVDPDVLEVEQKMKQLMSELKPVERYAVKYLEMLYEPDRLDELQQTEEEMAQRKLQWELVNSERLEQEEIQRKREEDGEFELAYSFEDSLSQMFCPLDTSETMPVWMPPTPPMSDSEFDPYVDSSLGYLYNLEPMEEVDLPPVAGELDLFRSTTKAEPVAPVQPSTPLPGPPAATVTDIPDAVAETVANIRNSFNKTPKESPQKSLFEAGHSAYRPKRDVRRPMTPPSPTVTEQEATDFPEWTVLEDYALLTAVTKGQQMSYRLSSSHAGHAPNWDYVSKWVSSIVGHYCSARACCNRYQYVILPREEGRVVTIDMFTKKARKIPLGQQDITSVKKFRMRTGQQFQQEGSSVMAAKVNQRIAAVCQTMAKRQGHAKERAGLGLANYSSVSNRRKHESHLQSFGLSPEKALSPENLAEMREERLKELKKQHLLQQQQQQQQHQQQQQQQQMALIHLAQQQQSVNAAFQPLHHQSMQQMQLTPTGSQGALQARGVMEATHPLVVRGTTSIASNYGIVSSAGTLAQQQHLQFPMQQQQTQLQQAQAQPTSSQIDASQIAVSVHPASRLVASVQHVRHTPGLAMASSQAVASGNARPQAGVPGMGARSSLAAPAGVTTATVYRQLGTSGLIRAQRTPPSTPAPAGLHAGTSIQVAPGTIHQRTTSMVPSSVSLAPIAIAGTSIESGGTSIIGPVVVQAPQTTVRFQAVSSAGARQKIQFGSGGFLVAADASKPTVLSVPSIHIAGANQGASASHQTVTPISIAGAGVTRATTLPPRHHVQLTQSSLAAAGKKNIALPRIATFTHGVNRGGASPVHLVASPVSSRIAGAQTMHSVRQAPSPSSSMRAPGAAATAGRSIPSISMIMPIGRMEMIPGASATASSAVQSQPSIIASTSGSMVSPQGAPTTTQSFGAPVNRGQQ